MTLIVVLFLVGCTLVIAEVMFPSFGILGLLSATSFLIAVLEAFEMGQTQGYVAIGIVIVAVPAAFATGVQLLKYSPMGNKLLQKGPEHASVSGVGADTTLKNFEGKTGVTITPCRPSGTVEVDGQRIDVVSSGPLIEPGRRVKLVYVEGNRVVIEEVGDSEVGSPESEAG